MNELLDASFAPVNLPATILMIFVVLYWVVFMFGFLDLQFLDLDLDVDADMEADLDVDADVDADAEADTASGASGLKGILSFLNLGSVPLMVWLSIFAFCFWSASVILNHLFLDIGVWVSILMMIGAVVGSLIITKFITWPLKKVFKLLNNESKPLQIVGKLCKVTISVEGDGLGQAEYMRGDDPILIKVKPYKGAHLVTGQQVLILEHNKKQNIYLVEPFNIE